MSYERHGPTPREQEIEQAFVGGTAPGDIAQNLGVTPDYVQVVLRRMSGSWSENDRFEAMVRSGSMALAQRIEAVGGRWL